MHRVRYFVIIILLCIACFVVNLGLLEPDLMESRNFITAREMIDKGNWIIPTMNNELRLEKQPLVTWFTAISAMCGNSITNNFILRLPAAIIATFMVFFFYGICFELTKRDDFAFLGSIIFATSLLVVQMARVNSWDIYTHAFMTGSIWLQLKALHKSEKNIAIWLFAGLLMGLSIFSKGPVGLYVLWIPFLISYYFFVDKIILRKNYKKITGMFLLALLIGLGWHIYLFMTIPDEITNTLSKESVSRGTRHVRPFYFYFHFPVYIGIWAIPMLGSLFFKPMRQRISDLGNYKFLILWVLSGLILLSLIPEKKERYMLPLEIPMSLMVSYLFYSIYHKIKTDRATAGDHLLIKIHGWVLVLILVLLPVIAYAIIKNSFFDLKYIIASVISILTACILILKLIKRTNINCFKVVFVSSILVVTLITTIYLPLVTYKIYNQGYRDVSVVKQQAEYNSAEFLSAGELNMQLIWKIGKPVKPVPDMKHFQFKNQDKYFIFCYSPIETVLSNQQLEKVKITSLGMFDCNQDKGSCKIYVDIIENKF